MQRKFSSFEDFASFVRSAPGGADIPENDLRAYYIRHHDSLFQAAPGSDERGAAGRGWDVAWKQLPQLAGGAIFAIGDWADLDSWKEYGLDLYRRKSEEIAALQRDTDSFMRNWEQGDIGDWAEFLKYGAGYVAGQAVQTVATGGLGALGGRAALAKAVVPFVEKKIGEKVAAGVARDVAEKEVAREFAAKLGGWAAWSGFNFTQELGEIYPDMAEQVQADGREIDTEDRLRAIGAAALATIPETIADALNVGAALRGAKGATLARRAATQVPVGMAREAGTEAVQTAIERYGAQQEVFSDEGVREIVDSAALGAIGGGLAGGVAALHRRREAAESGITNAAVDAVQSASDGDEARAAALAAQGLKAEIDLTGGVAPIGGGPTVLENGTIVPEMGTPALESPPVVMQEAGGEARPGGLAGEARPVMLAGAEGVRPMLVTDLKGQPAERIEQVQFASPEAAESAARTLGAGETRFKPVMTRAGEFKVERTNLQEARSRVSQFVADVNSQLESIRKSGGSTGVIDTFNAVAVPHEMVRGGSIITGIGRFFGRRVQFFRQTEGSGIVNGAVGKDGTIFVNVNSAHPLMQVLLHEVTHTMERDAPELYAEFVEAVKPFVPKHELEKALAIHGNLGDAWKEAVANVSGSVATNRSFWKRLAERSPNGFRAFAEKLLSILRRVLEYLRGQDTPMAQVAARDVAQLERTVAEYVARYESVIRARQKMEEARARKAEERAKRAEAAKQAEQAAREGQAMREAEAARVPMADYAEPMDGQVLGAREARATRVQINRAARKLGLPKGAVAPVTDDGQPMMSVTSAGEARPQVPSRGVNVEVAPNPDYREIGAAFDKLPFAVRDAITRRIAGDIIPQILRLANIPGNVVYTQGGFLGKSNPSIIVETPAATFDEARLLAKLMGYVFDQKAMIAYDESITEGDSVAGFIRVRPEQPLSADEVDALFQYILSAVPQAEGYTLRDGSLIFGNFSFFGDNPITDEQMHAAIDAALEKRDGMYHTSRWRFASEYMEPGSPEGYLEGTEYGSEARDAETGRDAVRGQGRDRLESLRAQAARPLRQEIARAEGAGAEQAGGNEGTVSLSAARREQPAQVVRKKRGEQPNERSQYADEPGDIFTKKTVSTRYATAPTVQEADHDIEPMHVSLRAALRGGMASNLAKVIRGYTTFRPDKRLKSDEAVIEAYVNFLADNLVWLYNKVPEGTRELTRQWYVGASRIANRFASAYGITDMQAAGVIAALSPQNEWFNNVWQAKEVISFFADEMKRAHRWDSRMEETAKRIKPPAAALTEMRNRSFNELVFDNLKLAAWFFRVYSETYSDRTLHEISPDGSFGDIAITDAGKPAVAKWGSTPPIENAIAILRDGSHGSLSKALGNNHKVRSFYNNIVSPNDQYTKHVTVDTHAVAAAHLMPFSAEAHEVQHSFGKTFGGVLGPGKSGVTGTVGTYAIYHEAYVRAAERVGVLPRELQSITWEAVRDLFPAADERHGIPGVREAWVNYSQGKISAQQARDRVWEVSHDRRRGRNNKVSEEARPAGDAGELGEVRIRRGQDTGVAVGRRTVGTGPRPLHQGGRAAAGRADKAPEGGSVPLSASARPAEPAVRPGDRSGRPGSVEVVGIHYGNARVPMLSGSRYGTGIKGEERHRLAYADPRLRRRIYFYIGQEGWPLPPPEEGLGPWVYRARLSNLYESGVSPALEYERSQNPDVQANNFELAVIEAGYDGYVHRGAGVAVVLNRDVPVELLGHRFSDNLQVAGRGGSVSTEPPFKRALMQEEIERLEPVMGQMPQSARLRFGTLTVARPDLEQARNVARSVGVNFSVTETPEFKRWFGNSKVVDKDGRPLVVYRGDATEIEDYNVGGRYSPGLFFAADKARAEYYGTPRAFFLKMENPLDLSGNLYRKYHRGGDIKQIIDDLFDEYYKGRTDPESGEEYTVGSVIDAIENGYLWQMEPSRGFRMAAWQALQEAARNYGHDGMIAMDSGEGVEPGLSYVVYDSKQVKSATDNSGAFDPDDSRVKFSLFVRGSVNTDLDGVVDEDIEVDDMSLPIDTESSLEQKIAEDLADYRRGRDPVSDRQVAELGRDWMALAADPKNFHYPLSSDTELENVAYDMAGRLVKVRGPRPASANEKRFSGGFNPLRAYDITIAGDPAWVFEDRNGRVVLNVNNLRAGQSNGSLLYQIVSTWAANSGRKFIGDPAGLSERALFRRTVNMMSGALRAGTTKHIEPHPLQVEAGLEWRKGDDEFNIGSMALWIRDTMALYAPQRFDAAVSLVRALPDAAGRTGGATDMRSAAGVSPVTAGGGPRTARQVAVTELLLRRILAGERRGDFDAEDGVRAAVRAYRTVLDGLVERPGPIVYSVSPAVTAAPFYSELARQIERASTNSAPAAGWKDFIKGLTSKGVKAEEIEWSGIREWLDLQQGKISKQQVLDYLRGNGVRVDEVVLRAPALPKELGIFMSGETKIPESADEWIEKSNVLESLAIEHQARGNEEQAALYFRLAEQANEMAERLETDSGVEYGATKYSSHKLSGGTGYTELLLRLPSPATKFKGSHFVNYDNILAHVRFDERETPDGRRVLFIQEIQSDWAQQGRKKGFRTAADTIDGRDFEDWNKEVERLSAIVGDRNLSAEERAAARSDLFRAAEKRDALRISAEKIKPAPFVTKTESWVALVLKRMIGWAAERGFDAVAWATGEQQSNLYRLSQVVRAIEWAARKEGGKFVTVSLEGASPAFIVVDPGGTITRVNGNGNLGRLLWHKLDEVFGKDVAKKILEAESGELVGENLNIGGEGMRAFYDKIVPNVANDVLKKLGGGRVAEIEIRGAIRPKYARDVHRAIEEEASLERIEKDRFHDMKQPGFEITSQMRAKALAGMPLFSVSPGDLRINMSELRARLHDAIHTGKRFGWWDRTIGTQFHKATKDADFRRVFDLAQRYLDDVSGIASRVADNAPDILRKMHHWTDAFKGAVGDFTGKNKADLDAMSRVLFEGTLEDRVYKDEELREKGLTEHQIKLYRQARRTINASLDQLATSEMVRITRGLGIDDARAAVRELPAEAAAEWLIAALDSSDQVSDETRESVTKILREKADRVAGLKARGYAPLMRFGEYALEFELDGEYNFMLFESSVERGKMARAVAAEGAKNIRTGTVSQQGYKLFRGLDPNALEVFGDVAEIDYIDENGRVVTMKLADDELFQAYLKMATAARSTLKRLIKRKGVAGYDTDGQRVLASFVTSNARMASANYNMLELVRAAAEIDKNKGDVKDEAVKLVEYIRNPTEESAKIRGLLFANYLGGSVASALVNMTQPIMMSFPYLSQWGAAKAAAALRNGFKIALSRDDPTGELGAAMRRAAEDGIVEPHEIHMLYADASRKFGSDIRVRRFMTLWGSLFSAAEAFNRRATFAAAFEIGNRLTADELKAAGAESAYDFAVRAVRETQGIYNKGNRPNWARGTLGSTLFTFKQYTIAYLEFVRRLPRKQQAIALGMLVLLSGLQGLPFADDLDDLIDTIGQGLGYNVHAKAWKMELLTSVLGKDVANFVLFGASTIPGVPLDVQGRMSMGNLIPGSDFLKPSNTDQARSIAEVAGAPGGFFKQIFEGGKEIATGNVGRGMSMMAPVAIQNILKGADMLQTGLYRDMSGKAVVPVSEIDAVVKVLGFQPNDVAREIRRTRTVTEMVKLAKEREKDIAAKWAEGIFLGDTSMVRDAMDELRDWNSHNPDLRIRISPDQISRRLREMRATRAERIQRSAPREIRATVRQELGD